MKLEVLESPQTTSVGLAPATLQGAGALIRPTELASLTGLRFYLASFVFISHVAGFPGLTSLQPYKVFQLGNFGVSLFFVLSGFILTYNYADLFQANVATSDWKR